MRSIALIAFLAQGICLGQGTFNVVHNYTLQQGWPNPSGGTGRSVLETDSGYIVFGHHVATAGLTKDFIYQFDGVGNWLSDFELNASDPSNQNFGYSDPLNKDGYGVIGAISSFDGANDSTSQIALIRVANDGSPLWQVSVTDSCLCGVKQARLTSSGKVLLAGYNDYMAMLLISDTLGEIDTLRSYANTWEALSVCSLNVGGYCFSGYQVTGVDNAIWVMRLDSIGDVIWRRDIGGSKHAGDNVSAIQTQDGGIVATCSFMPFPGGPFDPQWNYFRKWDIDGNLLWTKQYNEQDYTTGYDLEELPNGALVACGGERSPPAVPISKALLFKLEPDGDLIWLRRYYHYASSNSTHIPYDVEPTSDGGFVLTGYAKQGQADSIPGLQMVWLLKVDSMGCLLPGCGGNGIQEIALGLEDALRVHPNPANTNATVTATLPNDLEVRGTLSLLLVDALGRTVLTQNMGKRFTTTTLDLSRLPHGLYHLHLRDDMRWLSGVKLVVE